MKITGIETIRLAERPNLVWVHVETDEGLTGLGETFFGPGAVEAHLHDTVAPLVIGRDPLAIDRAVRDLVGYLGFRSTGAEMRGNSAFDLALWDIFGKATGQPVAQLLGGFTREASAPTTPARGPTTSRRQPASSPRTSASGSPTSTT
jgi:galactonate dehydratase